MLPMILLSFTAFFPWEFQSTAKGTKDVTARYEYQVRAAEAVPMLLNRMLKAHMAAGEDLPLVMVYGIDDKPGTGVDTFRILAHTEAFLKQSEGMGLYQDEYRVQFEREMGYQAIERISRQRMLEYARDMGARYLLSGYIAPIEEPKADGMTGVNREIPGRLTFVLTDSNTGKDIWSESLVFVEPAGGENHLSARKDPR